MHFLKKSPEGLLAVFLLVMAITSLMIRASGANAWLSSGIGVLAGLAAFSVLYNILRRTKGGE